MKTPTAYQLAKLAELDAANLKEFEAIKEAGRTRTPIERGRVVKLRKALKDADRFARESGIQRPSVADE